MTPGSTRTTLHLTSALAAGLLLRLWFIHHAASVNGDTLIYGNIARNWLEHRVYGFLTTPTGPRPTLIRLPGYPLFLAACFALFGADHYTPVLYVQCLFDLASCLLIAALAGRLFGPRARVSALWLAALCPFTATYVAAPLTEVLTLTSIALAFYALERWRTAGCNLNRWLWVTGAAMAWSLLLRPEQGLLAAAIVPALLWLSLRARSLNSHLTRRTALLPALLVSLCVLLPLVPWTLRNWHTFHVVQPLAPRSATDPGEDIPIGFNRWYRTWGIDYASTEEVYWNYDSADIDIGDLPSRAFDSQQQYTQTANLLADYNKTDSASPAFNARFTALARDRIHADPVRYFLALPLARLLNMFFRPRAEMMQISLDWWNYRAHHRHTLEAAALAALNLAYFLLGFAGLYLWHKQAWSLSPTPGHRALPKQASHPPSAQTWGPHAALAWSMLAFLILRSALLLTLDNSEPRYTLEFFPLVIVWVSFLFRRQPARLPS